MRSFEPADHGPVFAALLDEERSAELGPGTPNRVAREQLDALTAEKAFAHAKLVDLGFAAACCSALWLYHDYLDQSHRISQNIPGATGSYWHGIMHRREPDASNAKYWFRRVGTHPVFTPLAQAARELIGAQAASDLDTDQLFDAAGAWDPFAFVDACESARGSGSPAEDLCRRIQLAEWRLLFHDSYRQATGA